ncbi:OsmC family protein [Nitrosomonas eutropha]|uniref:Redox protein n=2 Tax=Nitrosomonas eutropha TaxID=916 RepID=A0ABX5M8C8_9PROT|nr:OsmC family protein [Nitrosomonas eutropha]ABI59672.1 OsmC family protein [Nitrosomonas eutropha C91]PXV82529.1 putative redox protein [Nitrosomonas eutropha]SCX00991.1 putative redox protein [Nitrosomonas eutropha]SEI86064.1 putative redox protein [Nitrosomonas eutropha]
MKVKIAWQEGVSFLGQVGSGHSVLMDGAPEAGGKNQGPRPMEMILLGLGGCTSFDVVHILRKGRQEITGCQVEVDAQRATEDPKVFTHIHLHFIIAGRNLDLRQVERSISLSAEKYCSASMMLKATVNITHDYEVIAG